MKTVKWKNGARLKTEISAEAAAAELNRIRGGSPVLEARRVWEESADPEAPLHGEFTWDDEEAAKLYRDDEARHVIRAVVVAEVKGDDDSDKDGVRVWSPVRLNDVSGYQPTVEALRNPETREQILNAARAYLGQARKKLADLQECAAEVAAIDSLQMSIAAKAHNPPEPPQLQP